MNSRDDTARTRVAAKGAPADADDDDHADGSGRSAVADKDDAPDTPEQRFEDRYPQDVRVSDVVGKPLLAPDNASIGRIRGVTRSPDGKLALIVPVGGFFGIGGRLVAVPNESVASIGTAIISVDLDRAAYARAATWRQGPDAFLPLDTPMRVAITRH